MAAAEQTARCAAPRRKHLFRDEENEPPRLLKKSRVFRHRVTPAIVLRDWPKETAEIIRSLGVCVRWTQVALGQ